MATEKKLAISGVMYTDRRKFDLDRADIVQLYASENPFLAWMGKLKKRKVSDPDFKMFQDQGTWRDASILAAAGGSFSSSGDPGGTLTIACDNATNCAIDASLIGQEVEIWDTTQATLRGNALIQNVSGSNVTFVVLGNAAASNQRIASITDNDVIKLISTAIGEGQTSPEPYMDELSIAWNSTQISRTSLQITGTLYDAALYAGPKGTDELARIRAVKAKKQLLDIERKLLMGYRVGGMTAGPSGTAGSSDSFSAGHVTDKDGNVVRTTMGFLRIMDRYGRTSGDKQNVFTLTKATAKYADIVEIGEKMSQYGGPIVRDCFVGPSAMSYWTTLVNAQKSGFEVKISDMRTDETYGFNYKYLELGHITLRLIQMPLFHAHPRYKNYMLIPMESAVEHAVYRPDSYRTNIKTDDGFDGQKDEFFSDDGLYLSQTDTHNLIILQ